MIVPLPDAASVARETIERVSRNRRQFIDGPVDRMLADAPWADWSAATPSRRRDAINGPCAQST
jgi:hypothetical protein